jgi:hypothetical protein
MSCVIKNFVVPSTLSSVPSIYTFTVVVDSSEQLFAKDGFFKRIVVQGTNDDTIWNASTTEAISSSRLIFAGGTSTFSLFPYSDIVQQFNINANGNTLINAFSSVTQYK